MRTIKTVSRDTIIEAIKTENLGHKGGWVMNKHLPYRGNCTVCAVGGVLRHLGLPNDEIPDTSWRNTTLAVGGLDQVPQLLKEKDYLGALSSFFECRENSRLSQKVIRRKLIAFVKKNFPSRIRLMSPVEVHSTQELEDARKEYEERLGLR